MHIKLCTIIPVHTNIQLIQIDSTVAYWLHLIDIIDQVLHFFDEVKRAMSRTDCISNRNIKIIAAYLTSRTGGHDSIFRGLSYPDDRYGSPEEFFLNEDEWTTNEIFHAIFRRAGEISNEPYFYFNCGASSARLKSWGRFGYMARFFTGPDDGFRRLPFFNSNINDTKQIEIIVPPYYDRSQKKMRVILKVDYHNDIDVEKDYIIDAYRRGMISSIPTVWGLPPAMIRQPINPYDPEILLNNEEEFAGYQLDARMEGDLLTVRDPIDERRKTVGKKILLETEIINGKKIYMGRYMVPERPGSLLIKNRREAVMITDTVRIDDRILLKKGEICKGPYFIMEIAYDRLSWVKRLLYLIMKNSLEDDSEKHLTDTIDRLRETIKARNSAYRNLKSINRELMEEKAKVEGYNVTLEQKVNERTAELRKTQEDLLVLNRGLEEKVNKQVEELNRYNNLRRYLSPKLAEKILSSGDRLGAAPQRKMMTVMFTDIRNFSTCTDNLEPEELFGLLDKYISEMTKLIHNFDGTLDKIIGDGMLIFFGDPVPMEDHAQRSVLMAIEMQKKVNELKKEWQYFGYELGMGIGINTGYMTVGNIGSDMHMDYTVIGNQVNVASRLESHAGAGQILVSQRTYSRVSHMVEAEEIGEIAVKGIKKPVLTYNINCLKGP